MRASHRCRCGLPAGPFGLIGAAEGISYLVVIGFVASSLVAVSPGSSGSGFASSALWDPAPPRGVERDGGGQLGMRHVHVDRCHAVRPAGVVTEVQ